jgi:alkylation response protein AidB-like acyl-CoA dehydrogenase
MDLDFTTEQELLRDTVRGVCARHAGLDVVRKMEDDPVGYPEAFWAELAKLGLTGMTIPEQHDGSGMTMLDAVIVYTEFGRALAPSPHFASSVLSAGVIAAAGSDRQQAVWLPRLSAGEAVLSPAWLEPGRGYGPGGIQLEATRRAGGWCLKGTKRHVPFARAADALLVLARTAEGPTFFLVETSLAGLTMTQQMSVASDTQYQVDLNEVLVPDGALVGGLGQAWKVWDQVMHDGIILVAAQASGGARAALDVTVQYAKDRQQFDKPLGAFQAIAHYLADAVTAVDGAETLVWEAGWARTGRRPVSRLAPMAKLFACQTYRDVTAMAQQVYGGMGFTLECDIQLYFRRAKQLQLSWWDSRYLEELVAADVLG